MGLLAGSILLPFLLLPPVVMSSQFLPDKFLDGLSERMIKLENRNVSLHVVEGGDPSKRMLFFVHGFPQFMYVWRHQIEHFKRDYHVVAIDLRGFGESERPTDVKAYELNEFVEDLVAAIELFKNESTNKDVTLVSHDIGAAISCMALYAHPNLVDRFVMMNAPNPRSLSSMKKTDLLRLITKPYSYKLISFQVPKFGEHVIEHDDFAFFDNIFYEDPNGIVNRGNGQTFDRNDLQVYKTVYAQRGAVTSALNFYRAPVRAKIASLVDRFLAIFGTKQSDEKQPDLTDKIEPKTLVIWGKRDNAFGVEFGKAAVEAARDGQLLELDASHWVAEDVPDEVNKAIEEFIAGGN